ncbi:hypothetical protein [Bradyrhizobium elkanii]|uniref:Uncharacterized protein n=1 Tax=Bradyrhizobium elkanii TaxID=29448 RepID=A0ABV4FAH8_BRAEL|nr:hypothetical protein [Bradyrhizobium elkanii]MCP1752040.1 hypothetical protein [Bradyrhizobium elkanii]MCP1977811.1 hypothetical protein [Bradyrhizobium elkanii]MCS3887671.1 hypothetical protein [Bradyrhizobium elkanii]MCS4213310.1 hypothetical protein [Bradyrhizobium elkanii]MCW2213616.1 hypothetical protein [Bradyrhizobium elkanii]
MVTAMPIRKLGRDERVLAVMRPALMSLLELGVKHRLHRYILDQAQRDWRELESELHAGNHPIKGIGIIATREIIEIHDQENVGSEEISPLANQIPFDAAMAAYAFTILETCGDDVVSIVNPAYEKRRLAWHREIPTGPQRLPADPLEISEAFAAPFGLPPHRGYVSAVRTMSMLKETRNAFAHRGSDMSFNQFYEGVLRVAVSVYFANLHSEKELRMFPFSDLMNKWA